jgi:hypothetical protein
MFYFNHYFNFKICYDIAGKKLNLILEGQRVLDGIGLLLP